MPTLYGADSIDGALSETILHDVPTSGDGRHVRRSRLLEWLASTIAPTRELQLVDLRARGLKRLGTTRASLIESPATAYPDTARWASALYHGPEAPDGLVWESRQRPGSLAVVLFGRGRVRRDELRVVETPLALAIGPGLELVYAAAERAGITVVS